MNRVRHGWRLVAGDLLDDATLQAAVIHEHRRLYSRYFRDDFGVNHELPIMTHAFRRLEQWRVFLLLTPWMLARLFFPDRDPGLEIPPEWSANAREGAEYMVMGPTFDLPLLTGKQRAHLNYSAKLGHYLLHPLILSMTSFTTPAEVFSAWNRVIEARNKNLELLQKQNPVQEEISRREFFTTLFEH